MTQRDDEFLDRLTRALDESVEQLDSATARELQARRRQALSHAQAKPAGRAWIKPAAGLALAAGIGIVGLSLLWPRPEARLPALPLMEDLELLSSGEELELYQELDFYQWLEQAHEAG